MLSELRNNNYETGTYCFNPLDHFWRNLACRATAYKATQERAPFMSRLLYAIPVLIGAFLMAADNTALGRAVKRFLPRSAGLDVVSIISTAAGIAFAVWARFYLGGNWSSAVSVKVGHQLVRTGPYAWVRRPIYSGILLAI